MLVVERAVEIRVLSRLGKSIREIARMLEVWRNTAVIILAIGDFVRAETSEASTTRPRRVWTRTNQTPGV